MVVGNKFKTIYIGAILVLLFVILGGIDNIDRTGVYKNGNNQKYVFEGDGTIDSPYIIRSEDDLIEVRKAVALGETFEHRFFEQKGDIVLQNDWIPIGDIFQGTHFDGVYDGNGYAIKNIRNGKEIKRGFALFNYFGGVVANLGMEDVDISSDESASLVYYAVPNTMNQIAILNCYATGEITGGYSGGLAYDLNNAVIANSFSALSMPGTESKGILFGYGNVKIYCCNSLNELCDEQILVTNSEKVSLNELENIKSDDNNLDLILTQHLFADHYDVKLCKWTINKEIEGGSGYSVVSINKWGGAIRLFFYIVNNYIGLILCIILMIIILKNKISIKGIYAGTIISGIISIFLDCKLLSLEEASIIKVVSVLLYNVLFLICLKKTIPFLKSVRKKLSKSLLLFMLIVFCAALFQLDSVPRYDSAIYYGSLIRACDLFDLTFFSYIGAFVCWKWIHGAAFFLAPIEFLWPGTAIGANISVIIIMEITIVITYLLIKYLKPHYSELSCVLLSIIMIFMPYQIGMYNYLCMDTLLAYFVVWLLYAYLKKNDYMISFCGFLLIFTKETGLVYYCSFLIAATAIKLMLKYKKDFVKGAFKWFSVKRIFLWIFPAFLYLMVLLVGDKFIIQNFYGGADPFLDRPRSIYSYANTIADTFIWGYRWLFLGFIIISLFLLIFYARKKKDKLIGDNNESLIIFVGIGFALFMTELMLLIYKGDADCPRYTAVFNVFYCIGFAIIIDLYSRKKIIVEAMIEIALMLMVIQTYFTIDPFIISSRYGMETGTGLLYKIAFNSDDRKGMNIGVDYGKGYGSVGDIYAYNVQYNYYDSLIKEMLNDIQPNYKTKFYVLDIVDYEMSLTGQQYPLFWEPQQKRLTYKKTEDNYVLNVQCITSEEIINEMVRPYENDFYIIIPYRVDEHDAINCLRENGYYIKGFKKYKNNNGVIKVYNITKF